MNILTENHYRRSFLCARVEDLARTDPTRLNPLSAKISSELNDPPPPPLLGGGGTFMETVATLDVVPRLSLTEY